MLGEAKGVVLVYKMNAVKAIVFAMLTLSMTLADAACLAENVSNYNLRIFIYWMIVAAPVLVKMFKVESGGLISMILVGQIAGYIYYESGVSQDCNIRIDIVFAAVSVVWMLYRFCCLKEKQ